MKKWSVILTIILILTLSACESKGNNNQTTAGQHTTSTAANENSSTIEGKTSAETSTQVSNNENSVNAVNSTKVTTINKTTATNKNTTANQSKAQTVTTTTRPSTTVSVRQDSYTPEAWGTTLEQMEAELASYSKRIGMTYRTDFTLESGHWTTPTSSNIFKRWNEYKSKLCENIYYYHIDRGYSEVRVIFQYTNSSLRDGSKVECIDAYIVVK